VRFNTLTNLLVNYNIKPLVGQLFGVIPYCTRSANCWVERMAMRVQLDRK